MPIPIDIVTQINRQSLSSASNDVRTHFGGLGRNVSGDFERDLTTGMAAGGRRAAEAAGSEFTKGFKSQIGRGVEEISNSFGPLGSGFRGVTEGMIGNAGAVGTAIGGIAAVAGVVITKLYEMGEQWHDVTKGIITNTTDTDAQVRNLVENIKSTARDTAAPIEEIADIATRLHRAFGLNGEPLEKLTHQIADLNDLTGEQLNIPAMVKTMRGFGIEVNGASDFLDRFYDMHKQGGKSMNDLLNSVATAGPQFRGLKMDVGEAANFLATMQKAGIDGDTAIKGLRVAIGNLSKEQGPKGSLLDKFLKDEQGRDVKQRFGDLITQLQNMYNEAENTDNKTLELAANDLAKSAFGRGWTTISDSIKRNKLDVDDLNTSIKNTGASIEDDKRRTDTWRDEWIKLKNTIQTDLEPAATAVFKNINDDLVKITNTFSQEVAIWKNVISDFRNGDLGGVIKDLYNEDGAPRTQTPFPNVPGGPVAPGDYNGTGTPTVGGIPIPGLRNPNAPTNPGGGRGGGGGFIGGAGAGSPQPGMPRGGNSGPEGPAYQQAIGSGAAAPASNATGAERWRPAVRQALAAYGAKYGISNTKAWEDAMVRQIQTESGGNTTAINRTDSNAAAGHPSQGIAQFIPSTFNAWNITGGAYLDPYAQIAAMIPYVVNTYGMGGDGSPNRIGRGVGYETGGPARGGAGRKDDIPSLLTRGEHVLTVDDVDALGGHAGVYALRQSLHAYDNGGGVFPMRNPAGIDPQGGKDGTSPAPGPFAPWWDMDWMPPEHPEKVGPSIPGVQGKWWHRGPTAGKSTFGFPPIGKNRKPLPGERWPDEWNPGPRNIGLGSALRFDFGGPVDDPFNPKPGGGMSGMQMGRAFLGGMQQGGGWGGLAASFANMGLDIAQQQQGQQGVSPGGQASGPPPIQGRSPALGSALGQGGSGVTPDLSQVAGAAGDLFPGAGIVMQKGAQLAQRAIQFGGQALSIGMSGIAETLLPNGSPLGDPMNNWLGKMALGVSGVRPATPSSAGQQTIPMQTEHQGQGGQPGPGGPASAAGQVPLIGTMNVTSPSNSQQIARDVDRQINAHGAGSGR